MAAADGRRSVRSLPARDGLATFFVGQLGKYIPGSVWSIGAQAQMAGRHVGPGPGHRRRRAALPRLPRRHRRRGRQRHDALRRPGLAVAGLGVGARVGRLAGRPAAAGRARARASGRRAATWASASWTRSWSRVLMAVAWLGYAVALVLLVARSALARRRGARRRLRAGVRRRRRGRGRTRRRRCARGALRAAPHAGDRRRRRHRAGTAGARRAHGRGRGHGGGVVVCSAPGEVQRLRRSSPSRIRSSVNSNSVWLSHQPSGSSSLSCSSDATIAVR